MSKSRWGFLTRIAEEEGLQFGVCEGDFLEEGVEGVRVGSCLAEAGVASVVVEVEGIGVCGLFVGGGCW